MQGEATVLCIQDGSDLNLEGLADCEGLADTRSSYEIPLEEKERYALVLGLRDLRRAATTVPRTRLVSVMDREADIFELFDERRTDPSVDLLVRAHHNRGTTGAKKLFDAVRASEPRLTLELVIGRKSARPKRSKQKAQPARQARTATVTLRYQPIELAPPSYHRDKATVPLWITHVGEEYPPAGATPVN